MTSHDSEHMVFHALYYTSFSDKNRKVSSNKCLPLATINAEN